VPRGPVTLLAVAALSASCATSGTPTDPTAAGEGHATVGEVQLEVPAGWEATDDDLPPGVLEARRWRPEAGDLTSLQLVVGCGGTVDELVTSVVRGGRGAVSVSEAVETEGLDVPGLEATRGLVLDLEGTVLGGEVHELRTAGLYGQTGEALLLLELAQPAADFDPALAEEIFRSVRVDGEDLTGRCEAG
jgi:hypothetical protein